MAYALGIVIWALSLCVGALMFESAAARATPTLGEMGVAGDTLYIISRYIISRLGRCRR
jgi:hypothetical protein